MKKSKALMICLIVVLLMLVVILAELILIITNPGWHSVKGKKLCYSDEDGRIATGYQLINGKPYYFSKIGLPMGAGWIESDEGRFHCEGNGELSIGWHYLDQKAYYFFEAKDIPADKLVGAEARRYTTSGGISIGDEGYLEGDEALAIAYALDVLDRYGWSLESAYKYSASLRFVEGRDEVYGRRIHKCAVQGFKYGKGNCLSWAGTFCVMAKVIGYDCRLVWGTIHYNGGESPHGWTEIWEDDGIHVYDPRKNDGKDMTGFDVRYGEKGSRKYTMETRQYFKW